MAVFNDVINVLLYDVCGVAGRHRVELELEADMIYIRPTGYGDKRSKNGCGVPARIEYRNGIPYLLVWDDINVREPSHIISLERAAESRRKE